MKSIALSTVIAAAALGIGAGALAQDQGHGNHHRDGQWQGQHGQAHAPQVQAQPQQQRFEHRNDARPAQYAQRPYAQQQYRQPQYQPRYVQPQYPQRAWAGDARQWRRGDVLPWQYRQHYVSDWRAHRLYAPPYGYQWVESDDGDYLLVALATGLIANLMLNAY
jgi:Ni/Co efflux regulator RcnB